MKISDSSTSVRLSCGERVFAVRMVCLFWCHDKPNRDEVKEEKLNGTNFLYDSVLEALVRTQSYFNKLVWQIHITTEKSLNEAITSWPPPRTCKVSRLMALPCWR